MQHMQQADYGKLGRSQKQYNTHSKRHTTSLGRGYVFSSCLGDYGGVYDREDVEKGLPSEQASADFRRNLPKAYKNILAQLVLCLLLVGVLKVPSHALLCINCQESGKSSRTARLNRMA